MSPALSVVVMSITGLLVVLLAVGPQSVQGRTVTYESCIYTIRDNDNELLSVSCTSLPMTPADQGVQPSQ